MGRTVPPRRGCAPSPAAGPFLVARVASKVKSCHALEAGRDRGALTTPRGVRLLSSALRGGSPGPGGPRLGRSCGEDAVHEAVLEEVAAVRLPERRGGRDQACAPRVAV